MAHLGGARPAHGQRWPERRAARRLGLQVELVCERVSRERGPPDTILGRERRWVLVRGWENLFLVRERRFGVRREGARGRDRRRGVRGRSRDDALRDPCASRSSPWDGALDASPVRSPPEIDPPPEGRSRCDTCCLRDCGLLTSACVLPVCPSPAGGMSSPLGGMVAGYSRFLIRRVNPPTVGVPGAQGSEERVRDFRLPVLARLVVSGERRHNIVAGVVQMVQLTRRLRFNSIHTITPVGKQCKKFQQWSWGFAARTLFFHLRGRPPSLSSQARTRSLARVPQPCVLSCSRAMRGAYHAPDRARVNPPRRGDARGAHSFSRRFARVFAARHPRSPFPPNRR